MTPDDAPVPLLLTVGHVGSDQINLRFPAEYSDEILTLLDDHNLRHSTAIELSAGNDLWIEAVTVFGAAGGLAGIAAVVRSVTHRHSGKRFMLERDGLTVDAKGFSEQEVEQLLQRLGEQQREVERRWQETLRRTEDDHENDRREGQ